MGSEENDETGEAQTTTTSLKSDDAEYFRTQKSKFRFKSQKRKSNHDEDSRGSARGDGITERHHRHHRTKRRKRSEPPGHPGLYDDSHLHNTSSDQYLDPDTAFRESLFDAMADDEGAQFWEGVYGQPIPNIPQVTTGPTGNLEAMTEDEYAAHVRAEMYKKTHQYLIEEKERKEQAKKERARGAEQTRRQEDESERFRRKVEESLTRGRERKEKAQRASAWAGKWDTYQKSWKDLGESGPAQIFWPVWQGTREDVNKDNVEAFFLNAPTVGEPDQADLMKILKAERVRWHPDKIQQKLGGHGVNAAKMQAVTAVFQIIDQMWTEARESNN